VHIIKGMCRQCAWEKIKLECKICGEIIAKGYSRLLAHATAHYYTTAEQTKIVYKPRQFTL
jgi:hypothetical protein